MNITRRRIMQAPAAVAAAALLPAAAQAAPRAIEAIAFDGLALFDPRPVSAAAELAFPGRGAEFMSLWRTRQFEYTWLRNNMNRYADFERVTRDAMRFAIGTLDLRPREDTEEKLMEVFRNIRAWPDVAPVIASLRRAGYRLAILSNFTAPMLDRAVRASGLEGQFEPHLSTDRVQVYKPDPRAYAMASEAFRLALHKIAFVAFGGWDVAGAKAFGLPTYWANRLGARPEELGPDADFVSSGLRELPAFVGLQRLSRDP